MGEKVQLQLQRIREQGKHFTHKTTEYQLPIQYPKYQLFIKLHNRIIHLKSIPHFCLSENL